MAGGEYARAENTRTPAELRRLDRQVPGGERKRAVIDNTPDSGKQIIA
jgi:hypothetical protein